MMMIDDQRRKSGNNRLRPGSHVEDHEALGMKRADAAFHFRAVHVLTAPRWKDVRRAAERVHRAFDDHGRRQPIHVGVARDHRQGSACALDERARGTDRFGIRRPAGQAGSRFLGKDRHTWDCSRCVPAGAATSLRLSPGCWPGSASSRPY
jgi:hypothetical protein